MGLFSWLRGNGGESEAPASAQDDSDKGSEQDRFGELVAGLKKGSYTQRQEAARLLARIGGERASSALVAAIVDNTGNTDLAEAAVAGLIQIGSPSITPLRNSLGARSDLVRRPVVAALAALADPSLFETLMTITKEDAHHAVRAAAISGLGKLRDARACDHLIGVAGDKDRHSTERIAALVALGIIGGDSARRTVERAADDPYVRNTASRVLAECFGVVSTTQANMNLRLAAARGDMAGAERALASGADANTEDETSKSALYLAAASGHAGLVQLLLARGAVINGKRSDPLIGAAREGRRDVVSALIAAGANVHAVTASDGESALHVATEAGHADITRALLAAGANANAICKAGRSPLYVAALRGRKDVAEVILDFGGDINQRAFDELTPVGRAEKNKDRDMLELFHARGGFR